MNTVTVTIGHRFYDDHVSRDLPAGKLIKQTKTTVTLELGAEDYDELLSDAEYYDSERESFDFYDARAICDAARRCAARLKAVGRP